MHGSPSPPADVLAKIRAVPHWATPPERAAGGPGARPTQPSGPRSPPPRRGVSLAKLPLRHAKPGEITAADVQWRTPRECLKQVAAGVSPPHAAGAVWPTHARQPSMPGNAHAGIAGAASVPGVFHPPYAGPIPLLPAYAPYPGQPYGSPGFAAYPYAYPQAAAIPVVHQDFPPEASHPSVPHRARGREREQQHQQQPSPPQAARAVGAPRLSPLQAHKKRQARGAGHGGRNRSPVAAQPAHGSTLVDTEMKQIDQILAKYGV